MDFRHISTRTFKAYRNRGAETEPGLELGSMHENGEVPGRREIAVAALLLGVAVADRRVHHDEILTAYEMLEERLSLSPSDIHAAIEHITLMSIAVGDARIHESALNFLRKDENKALRSEVFRMVVEVAKADCRITPSEIRWLRDFVRRLSLSRSECRRALLTADDSSRDWSGLEAIAPGG